MKNFGLGLLAAAMSLIIAPLASPAGQDPGRPIEGNQLIDLVVDKTWYGRAIEGDYTWVEYYAVNGDAFYLDDSGFLAGSWDIIGEREICFDYPELGSFCFSAFQTPDGQVAIYDLVEERLIHVTTSIAEGDPESLARLPAVGDEVGQ